MPKPQQPSPLLESLRQDLLDHADETFRLGASAFFKETINPIGVRSSELKGISAKYWSQAKGLPPSELLTLCDELWVGGVFEEATVACKWCARSLKRLGPVAFDTFERWLATRVDNWAHCDDLGTHCIGGLLLAHQELLPRTLPWLTSPNRWLRRGAAVSCIPLAKRGTRLEHAFHAAETLLLDPDDLVRKGYGWLLKEASRARPDEVLRFVLDRRHDMPRVALRYAIELLPPAQRALAMDKP